VPDVASAGADSTASSEASTTTSDGTSIVTVTTASSEPSGTDMDSNAAQTTAEPMRECRGKLYPASAVLETDIFPRDLDGPDELEVLAGIRCVTGGINIRNVSDLAPARSLERVAILGLAQNSGLRHVDDLKALRRVTGALTIDNNPDLENLDGLAGLEAVQSIRIGFVEYGSANGTPEHGNDALRSLPSFPALVEPLSSILIGDNEILVDLGSPPSVATGAVWITNNDSLSFARARSWVDELQPLDFELICGNLDDPTPICEPPPLPGE
jgi:hypothetical protein